MSIGGMGGLSSMGMSGMPGMHNLPSYGDDLEYRLQQERSNILDSRRLQPHALPQPQQPQHLNPYAQLRPPLSSGPSSYTAPPQSRLDSRIPLTSQMGSQMPSSSPMNRHTPIQSNSPLHSFPPTSGHPFSHLQQQQQHAQQMASQRSQQMRWGAGGGGHMHQMSYPSEQGGGHAGLGGMGGMAMGGQVPSDIHDGPSPRYTSAAQQARGMAENYMMYPPQSGDQADTDRLS